MKSWYTVYTKTHQEFNVRDRLNQQGYESYLPVSIKDRRYLTTAATAKTVSMLEALFPQYLFVRMNEGEDDFHPVKKTPGVIRLVTFTEKEINGEVYKYPTKAPSGLIDELMALENEKGIHTTKHDYQDGDRVRIKNGPFHDVEALIQGTKDERVIALLDMLGQQHRVELDYRQVEPVN